MKKIIAGITALVIIAGTAIGFGVYKNSADKNTDTIEKVVVVEKGNVTAGVTESAAVSVQSLEQTYDLSLTSVSISASVEGGSGGGMGGSGMSMGGMGGSMMGGMSMGGGSSGGSMGSTSVSTSSSASSLSLVVDEVLIKEGQTVTKGDVIMTITEDSINEARAELENAVSSAELALKQAEIEENETLLNAKYEYDKRISDGVNAEANYNATLNEISSNISNLQSMISELQSQGGQSSQLENYQSQLSSALSSRTSDELSAKHAYEEALMYYENAQSLYDVAVNDVGNATEEAKEDVETAKSDLEAFNDYVSDGKIYAEYSGTIISIGYASGDTLSSDTAIASYADIEGITVTVNVTEDDIAAVNLDDTVEVTFLAYPDEIFSGYVSEIGSSSSSGNSSTVSYPVTVVITESPETLFTGMTTNVTFVTKQVKDVLYVSSKAVTTEGTASYVIVRDANGNESKKTVKTGFSNGKDVEITGVSEGDTLVIKGR